jgi:hypothetical protein
VPTQYANSTDGPCYVPRGNSGYITWTSNNTDNCTLSIPGQSFGPVPLNRVSPFPTVAINDETPYKIDCTGPGGSKNDTVLFIPTDQPPGSPDVNLKCIGDNGQPSDGTCDVASGNVGHMTWTSSNADACSMVRDGQSIGGVALQQNAPGMATPPLIADTTYTITCSGPTNPPANDTVSFHIVGTPPGGNASVDIKCNGTDGPCHVAPGY